MASWNASERPLRGNDLGELRDLVVEAWADRAPRRRVAEHVGAG